MELLNREVTDSAPCRETVSLHVDHIHHEAIKSELQRHLKECVRSLSKSVHQGNRRFLSLNSQILDTRDIVINCRVELSLVWHVVPLDLDSFVQCVLTLFQQLEHIQFRLEVVQVV